MHFVGGLGLVVVAVSLGTMRSIGASLYNAEGHGEHLLPDIRQDARFVLRFSTVVIGCATVLMSVLLAASGMRGEQAALQGLWLSIGGLMTAGFTPQSSGIVYYHSAAIEGALMLFMVIGSINFNLQIAVMHGRRRSFFKDVEVRTAAVVWCVLFICFALLMVCAGADAGAIDRTGLFSFISAVTTTGFNYVTPAQMQALYPLGAFIVLAIGMGIGTSVESTGGGIKLMRLGMLAKAAWAGLARKVCPHRTHTAPSYYHLQCYTVNKASVSKALTILGLFAGVSALGALVGIACGNDIMSSIFESVAMASNGGVSCGISTPGMPPVLEVVYLFEMWAGRLEFVAIFALIAKIAASLKPRD